MGLPTRPTCGRFYLINLLSSGPLFGWSGEIDDLGQFNTAAQQRGRGLFFSSHSCKDCHFAGALSIAQRPSDNGEPKFNTGVHNQAVDADIPQEPPNTGEQGRFFSIQPLFGIRDTARFFDDGFAATFLDVVNYLQDRLHF
jgi:cytochrome c peroxidase